MCGRYTLRADPLDVAREAGAAPGVAAFRPRYNIAPTQDVLAYRAREDQGAEAAILRWGLIPGWAMDAAIGNRMINARAESVAERPAFRAAFRKRRCAIAADGFYEWKREGKGKQPYLIRLKGDRAFAFAGLWDSWRAPDGGSVETCAIITTEANPLVSAIHDRMPVILTGAAIGAWVGPEANEAALLALLVPFDATMMEAYAVSQRVNRPANDDPAVAAPLGAAPARLL
jgi:putative SOS response-associated peptidase YedK